MGHGPKLIADHQGRYALHRRHIAADDSRTLACGRDDLGITIHQTVEKHDSLIALAREKKVYLAEAMWTWFSPAANQVKLWLMEDKLGKVTDANFTYHMKSVKYAPRVSDPKRAGGALLDITIYPITYAYRLWGYPVKIESSGTIENGIDYGEDVMLTFENGLTARISASIVDMKSEAKRS